MKSEQKKTPQVLAGLRVVELGEGVTPAYCGRWLAAFGAEVTKIEPPGGDWTRRYWPFGAPEPASEQEAGPLFRYLNAGKACIALDWQIAADQETLRRLIGGADLLIHYLDAQQRAVFDRVFGGVRKRDLVEVAVTPFADGPYARYAATSIVLLALGGYQFLTGEPGREPLALPGFQPEYLTSLYAVITALSGIVACAGQGRGARIELSSLEAMASLHQFTVSLWLYQGTIRSRHGSRWQNLHPVTLLPCRDGYLGFGVTTQDQWQRLCLMLERPDLIDDPRFADLSSRRQNADALDAILVPWLMEQGKLDLFQRAQEHWRLPVGPLYTVPEVLRDPQYVARNFWVQCDGGVVQSGFAAAMSETPWQIGHDPPPLTPTILGNRGQGIGGGALTPALSQREREETGLSFERGSLRLPHASSLAATERVRRPLQGRQGEVSPDTLPLAGVRVLDFTRVWSGPLCTRILADLGAEVIKISAPPPKGAPLTPGGAAGYWKLNRNKLGLVLDLRLEQGREIVRRLAARSEILVENFSARVMPNFGLGYGDLRAINPALVMLAMPGFGASGPYHTYMAYGPAIEPMTGLTSLLGYRDGPPLASAIAYPDAVAGLTAAAAILTALVYQRRSGRGQYIDLSQLEATTSLLGEYFLAYQLSGEPPHRIGNRHPLWSPQGTYRCGGEDNWLSICVRSDEEWRGLCQAMGNAALAADPRYATVDERRKHEDAIDASIASWTAEQDKFAAMELLQRCGVPAGAVLNARELLENPQLVQRGFYVDAEAGDGTQHRMAGTPWTINGRRRDHWQSAPLPGEHHRRILQDVLGLSSAEIDTLEAEGVLGEPA